MTVPAEAGKRHTRRRLGTIDDVRAIVPLPKSSLYDLARYGKLPGVVRVGRRLLFDLDQLDQWLTAGGHRAGE
jgi:excisionase family DNA binding protein